MANELQEKLDAILIDKNTNLLPKHLKVGVTCLGVEGNLEPGVMTETDYNTCETIADGILGDSIPIIPIEYIETTGTQWLDTGTPLFNSNTWKIELDFAPTAIYNYNGIWSTTEHSLSYESFITERNHQYSVYMVGSSDQDYISMSANTRYRYTDEFTGTSVISYVNGVQKRSYNTSVSKSTYNLTLFQCSEDTSKLKLYSAKLYADGALVRDFIPAKDGAGKIGLYDNVTNKFYYNAGTGTFVGGGVL